MFFFFLFFLFLFCFVSFTLCLSGPFILFRFSLSSTVEGLAYICTRLS